MLPFEELSSNSLISSQVEVSCLLSPGILLSLSKKKVRKLVLVAQVRSKVEISRGVLGHGLNCTDKQWRFAQCNCLLLSKLCGKPLILTDSRFARSFEVKRQKRERKNST